ncbi:MAG: phasin family protein [Alphaproteobacteria bacterium]
MQNTFCTKQLSEFTFQAIENWQKLGQSNLKVWEKLFQSQIELATALVDVVSLNGEEIAQSKDAAEIASLQAEIAQVSGKLVFENVQSTASILAEAGKAYGQLAESTLKAGGEFAKPAANAAKAKKAA